MQKLKTRPLQKNHGPANAKKSAPSVGAVPARYSSSVPMCQVRGHVHTVKVSSPAAAPR